MARNVHSKHEMQGQIQRAAHFVEYFDCKSLCSGFSAQLKISEQGVRQLCAPSS